MSEDEKIRSISQIQRLEVQNPAAILRTINDLRRALAECVDYVETIPKARNTTAWKLIKKAALEKL